MNKFKWGICFCRKFFFIIMLFQPNFEIFCKTYVDEIFIFTFENIDVREFHKMGTH